MAQASIKTKSNKVQPQRKASKNKKEEIIITNEEEIEFESEEEEEPTVLKIETKKEIVQPSKRGRKPANKPATTSTTPAATSKSPKVNRTFHIILDSIEPKINTEKINQNGGKFVGKIPNQAARKAFGRIAKLHKTLFPDDNKPCTYKFSIQEHKKSGDCKQKIYTYEGKRTKLDEPKAIKSKGTDEARYQVMYKIDLKSLRGKN